ncbi:hypothetical protein IFO66_00450 [Paenibacillus sp. CAU 1523]|uniref:Transposase n=1 Tax=Paenibacillus arenosi TaxID=2774142 RepID=A0ABR9ARW6_9BACL|nr:hypothetical protein [Paenibacillus arenosi]
MVNTGQATASDVLTLIVWIQQGIRGMAKMATKKVHNSLQMLKSNLLAVGER